MWFITAKGVSSFDGSVWKNYTWTDGLASDDVRAVSVDPNGKKWFCTMSGISIFDGKNWTKYTASSTNNVLPSDRVFSIAIDKNGTKWFGTETGVASCYAPFVHVEESPQQPAFRITGNYPNPFNPSTMIGFSLPRAGWVSLKVYDVTGSEVRKLISESYPAGSHSIVWDGRDNRGLPVSSGIYFSRLAVDKQITSSKMTLVK
jgi:hypothetical protein